MQTAKRTTTEIKRVPPLVKAALVPSPNAQPPAKRLAEVRPKARDQDSPARLLPHQQQPSGWLAFLERQQRRLYCLRDAPPWMISLIVHIALLLVLAFISLKSNIGEKLLLTLERGSDTPAPTLVEFAAEPIAPDSVDLEQVESRIQQVNLDLPVALPTPKFEALSPLRMAGIDALADVSQSALSVSSASSMFSGRSGALKQALLRSGGGTKETEDAVALGLAWLKRQQNSDGSWSMTGPYANGGWAENHTAATAMAMLAFMGAGHTHQSGQYQHELSRAVKWLVKQQDSMGFMANRALDNERMYAQAQATIALCELYGMTRDYWLRPYAQRACDFGCKAQSAEGGWRYVPRFDADTSVTGWFVMALKSGQAAGLEVSTQVFPKVQTYLDSVGSDYNAGYSYKIGVPASPAMTAEGLLCRQYLGWHRNMPGMAQGLGSLVANHPLDTSQSDVYYWYYATQSLHHYGGPLWEKWNERLSVDVPATQEKQGAERGSWSPKRDAWGANAGRMYMTCMSLFCLEVYYRHLPLYDLGDEAIAGN